jgi:hypothetical protein
VLTTDEHLSCIAEKNSPDLLVLVVLAAAAPMDACERHEVPARDLGHVLPIGCVNTSTVQLASCHSCRSIRQYTALYLHYVLFLVKQQLLRCKDHQFTLIPLLGYDSHP